MSSTRYMDIDSNFRDRGEYPNPAQFVLQMAQSSLAGTAATAKDPVCDSAALIQWNSSFNETSASTSVTITGISVNNQTDPYTFVITASANNFRTQTGFYNNAVLNLTGGSSTPFLTRIVSYKLLTTTSAQVTVNIPLPSGTLPTGGTITNPGNNTSTALVPLLFIPNGSAGDNYYNNWYVQRYDPTVANPLSTTQIVRITAYDSTTGLATLAQNTTANWTSSNSLFIIRKSPIQTSGALVYPAPVYPASVNTNVVQLATSSSLDSGYYTGSFLRFLTPVPTSSGFSVANNSYSQEIRISNYIAGSGTLAVSASVLNGNFTLSSPASNVDNYYVGGLLTVGSDTFLVLTYNGSTRSGTVQGVWGSNYAAGTAWTMNTAILARTVSILGANVTPDANYYEIEQFTKDNWFPLIYSGSTVSSTEPVCYEIELINLTLPNTTLNSGRGGRAIFYPYMYVELQQLVGNGNMRGIMYSNNPNSNRMLFKVSLDDSTLPVYAPFIKVDSDSMTQTIKFKPNDSFLFSVYLPDGTLFKTVAPDWYSPSMPNPMVQITACFSMKRL